MIETLLLISDNGFYGNCVEIFKSPITHCPDLLLLGLLQLNVIFSLELNLNKIYMHQIERKDLNKF